MGVLTGLNSGTTLTFCLFVVCYVRGRRDHIHRQGHSKLLVRQRWTAWWGLWALCRRLQSLTNLFVISVNQTAHYQVTFQPGVQMMLTCKQSYMHI